MLIDINAVTISEFLFNLLLMCIILLLPSLTRPKQAGFLWLCELVAIWYFVIDNMPETGIIRFGPFGLSWLWAISLSLIFLIELDLRPIRFVYNQVVMRVRNRIRIAVQRKQYAGFRTNVKAGRVKSKDFEREARKIL